MNPNNNLIKRALYGGAALLMSAALAVPAFAGAIDMDFTITTGLMTGVATSALDQDSRYAIDANPATIQVPIGALGNLNIQGFRTNATPSTFAIPTYTEGSGPSATIQNSWLQLNRNTTAGAANQRGLSICSSYDNINSPGGSDDRGCNEVGQDASTVDDETIRETVRFVIDPALDFAVRYLTFGFSDDSDSVAMDFQTGLGSTVSFALSGGVTDSYKTCGGAVCVIDIYALVEALAAAATLGADPDYIKGSADPFWFQGQDYIFDYLSSQNGFQFSVLSPNGGTSPGNNGDWTIMGANWVVADAVPEPMTLTLLGAGLIGAAAARRKRAA